jgi:hypothetical protein
LDCVSARDVEGANNLDCGRASRRRQAFAVRADEKLTAFFELESAIRALQSA